MGNYPKELKKQVGLIVGQVTGQDIKIAIPEAEKRIFLYEKYKKLKTSGRISITKAKEKLRAYVRNIEIAKHAVKTLFAVKYQDFEFKKHINREYRNKIYETYMKYGIEEKNIALAIKMSIKDIEKSLEDYIILFKKFDDCNEDQKIFALLQEGNIIHCSIGCKSQNEEDYEQQVQNLKVHENYDYSTVVLHSKDEVIPTLEKYSLAKN